MANKLCYMAFMSLFLLLIDFTSSAAISNREAEAYLNQFGYLQVLPQPRDSNADVAAYDAKRQAEREKALRTFQSFAGLPTTGILDDPTKGKMLAPRCGLSDLDGLKRRKTNTWDKPVITWKVTTSTRKMDEAAVRRSIAKALGIWSSVIPVEFLETHPEEKSDMEIEFAKLLHDDLYAFDGPGRTLAHAFYPKDGRVHFDDDEKWAVNDRKKINDGYTDFLSVAVHELGHSLGLAHNSAKDSIMLPYYVTPNEEGPQLSQGDVLKIQSLYGTKGSPRKRPPGTPSITTAPHTTMRATTPDRKIPPNGGGREKGCPDSIDAATTAMNGKTYFFKDKVVYYDDTSSNQDGLIESPINDYFPKFPGRVNAAVTTKVSQLTLLFQDRKVFAYEWDTRDQKFDLHPDFPKTLADEIPFSPTTAFRWTDENTVLSKGDDFVIYDENWNKFSFKNKMSVYFADLPSDAAKIFTITNDIIIVDSSSKYTVYKGKQKNKPAQSQPLKQLLNCS